MNSTANLRLIDSLEANFAQLKEQDFFQTCAALQIEAPVSTELYVAALKQGLFPWNDPGEPRLWWSPDPRAVLFFDDFHVSRSLAKCIRKDHFEITFDENFEGTVSGCAQREHTWLDPELIDAVNRLHQIGIAHSAEAWRDGELLGGVYGMAINGLFIGDSMFHRERNASKVALAKLIEHLRACGFTVMDCQVLNDHTQSLGAKNIARNEFFQLIDGLRNAPNVPRWQSGL